MIDLTPFTVITESKEGYTISTDAALLDVPKIHDYLSNQSYWARGRAPEIVERSIGLSLCFGVYTGTGSSREQVGFARVVTDYTTYAYLCDLFILPDFQGRGLGKWLVQTILEHPELQTVGRWTLYTLDAQDLYSRFGFGNESEPQRYMCYRTASPAPLPSAADRR